MKLQPHHRVVLALSLCATVVYCVFSITRHQRFGSGSWDMGCYVHNLYLLGFLKPPVSSVLGDANFWGGTNHFMPSLILAAPLAWLRGIDGWTSSLLVLQALLVAGAAVPLAVYAEKRGLSVAAVAAVSVAYLFSVGTQAMIEFDVHEIAPVPLLLFAAMLAFHVRRPWLGWVALLVMAGCKESAILYAAATGAWVAVFERPMRRHGLAAAALFTVAFVVVVQVVQPALLEEGARMIHVERFRGGLGGALLHMVWHPLDTIAQLVSPAPKGSTLLTTAGGFGLLPVLSPGAWLLAAPNLAERFLSDKREMWGVGFHYSLMLVAVCAFGAVDVLARVKRRAAALVVPIGFLASLVFSPLTPEFATLHKPYMADAARADRYRRALAVIPDDAPVVAQNHFLPHLAFRQFIWRTDEKFVAKADWVILDTTDSPWPHSMQHIARLATRLEADAAWRVAFSEASTRVFARVTPLERAP